MSRSRHHIRTDCSLVRIPTCRERPQQRGLPAAGVVWVKQVAPDNITKFGSFPVYCPEVPMWQTAFLGILVRFTSSTMLSGPWPALFRVRDANAVSEAQHHQSRLRGHLCLREGDSRATYTRLISTASGIHDRLRTVAFGLTSRMEKGSVERFRSACVRRNG
jgi:hypothetical protein